MKGLWLIGRAVLTHRRQGRLCPRRGLRWGWGAAQEGLPARGGDAALIWSRKIKVTGGASGSGRRECAGAKIGPFNLGELGKAPTCRSGAQGQVSPVPLSLMHFHAAGTRASPTVLPSTALAPLRDKSSPPSTTYGMRQGFQAEPKP